VYMTDDHGYVCMIKWNDDYDTSMSKF